MADFFVKQLGKRVSTFSAGSGVTGMRNAELMREKN